MLYSTNVKIKGFSLVELAIVLVIMGLLVVGAMSGRELLRVGELKAVISEIQTYHVAINNFESRYEYLPGDLPNATSFWTLGTANGNGDGEIGDDTDTDYTEPFYVWVQLSLSKMISGAYSGAGTGAVSGTNIPLSVNKGVGFGYRYFSAPYAHVDALGRNFPGNYIVLGNDNGTDNYASAAALTPGDSRYIDDKIDDGTPDFGRVLALSGCNNGAAPNIEYDLSIKTVVCTIAVNVD